MYKQQEKDYSLLRPFDLEAVLNGESICYSHSETKVYYITGPDAAGHIAYETQKNRIYTGHIDDFRMTPLCWVEGMPVYKGDVLYHKDYLRDGERVVVGCTAQEDPDLGRLLQIQDHGCLWEKKLTWTPPKVKREGWVNVYPNQFSNKTIAVLSNAYVSIEEANYGAIQGRINCIRIEWEE